MVVNLSISRLAPWHVVAATASPRPDFVDAVVFHPQAMQKQQQRQQPRYPHVLHAEASQLSVHAWHELAEAGAGAGGGQQPPQEGGGGGQQQQQEQQEEEEPPLPLYSGGRAFDLFYSEHLGVGAFIHFIRRFALA